MNTEEIIETPISPSPETREELIEKAKKFEEGREYVILRDDDVFELMADFALSLLTPTVGEGKE